LSHFFQATNEWLRVYKIPDGKPENVFAFSGEAKSKKYAIEIIHECHEFWKKKLVNDEAHAKQHKISMWVACQFPALIRCCILTIEIQSV
jgi:inorganic pyrophosphatase